MFAYHDTYISLQMFACFVFNFNFCVGVICGGGGGGGSLLWWGWGLSFVVGVVRVGSFVCSLFLLIFDIQLSEANCFEVSVFDVIFEIGIPHLTTVGCNLWCENWYEHVFLLSMIWCKIFFSLKTVGSFPHQETVFFFVKNHTFMLFNYFSFSHFFLSFFC